MSPALVMVLKVSVVFAVAWLALLPMRRASASLRYLVVALALAAGLLVPALELVVPRWEVIPASAARAITETPLPASAVPTRDGADPVERTEAANPAEAAVPVPLAAVPRTKTVDALGTAWLAGTIVLLAFLALRLTVMTVSVRRAEPLQDDAWNALLEESRQALGIRSPVRLLRRGNGEMPAVWGLRNPVILLPAECTTWAVGRRRAVLTHELAHVARRDVLMLTLGHVVCALHWFNPLVWALQHRLAVERERACDDVALTQGLRATHYAHHLVATAAAYRKHRSLAPVMAARTQLEGRVMAILNTDRNRSTATRAARLAVAAIVLVALVPLASVGLAEPPAVSQSDTADFRRHLAEIGYRLDDVDRLIAGLDSGSALTRGACAWALGGTGDPRAIDPLIGALDDADARVRQWSIRSLAEFDDQRIVDPLIDRLADRNDEVRQWAVRTLADYDDARIVDPLIDRLFDADAEVREWTVRALANVRDERLIDPLIDRLFDTDAEVREWAVRGLADVGDERAVDPVIDLLADGEPEIREWALRTLAELGHARSVEPMIDALEDEHAAVREWAVRGLGTLGDPRAIGPLRRLLDDPNPDVRHWAERALESIEG